MGRDYHADKPVSVRLTEDAKARLAAIAGTKGTSVHAEILTAVSAHIEAHEREAAAA